MEAITKTVLLILFIIGSFLIVREELKEDRISRSIEFNTASELSGLDIDTLKKISHGKIIDGNSVSIMKVWLTVEGFVAERNYTGRSSVLGSGY